MSDEQIQLKPCPFCGADDPSIRRCEWTLKPEQMECDCGARGPRGETDAQVREMWNTRTSEAELADLRQKLAEVEARERELREALELVRPNPLVDWQIVAALKPTETE